MSPWRLPATSRYVAQARSQPRGVQRHHRLERVLQQPLQLGLARHRADEVVAHRQQDDVSRVGVTGEDGQGLFERDARLRVLLQGGDFLELIDDDQLVRVVNRLEPRLVPGSDDPGALEPSGLARERAQRQAVPPRQHLFVAEGRLAAAAHLQQGVTGAGQQLVGCRQWIGNQRRGTAQLGLQRSAGILAGSYGVGATVGPALVALITIAPGGRLAGGVAGENA